MKNKIQNKMIFITFLIFIMFLSYNKINDDTSDSYEESRRNNINPPIFEIETSGSWSNFTFIHITGSNWSIAEGYDWVLGDGSWNNPYRIENITMDASSSPTGSGIYIQNSNESYFEIRNCMVSNSGTGIYDGGIKIENSTRGLIINNNCSFNGESGLTISTGSTNNTFYNNTFNDNVFNGIMMGLNSYNNTIIFNEMKRNERYGIRVFSSHSNNISYNKVDDNDSGFNGYGFYFSNADNNTIFNNTAIKNEEYGMYFTSNSDNNLIKRNYFFQDSDAGIYISGSVNNTLEYNIIDDIWGFPDAQGIHFISSSNSTIRHNQIFNCNYDGLYFESNCKWNLIFNNTIFDNSKGILIESSSTDNTISNNTVYSNGNDGIELSDSNYIIVENNTIYDQGRSGINIKNCNYSTYSANKLASCGFSISITSGNYSSYLIHDNNTVNGRSVYFYDNQIGLNSANFTNAGQIILYKCSNSVISDVNVSYTNYGLYLNNVNNSYFSNINAIHCYEGIYLTSGYNNTFNNCTTNYNEAYGSINLVLSENNTVINCTGAYGYYGLLLTNSHNNSVLYNNFSLNENNGIYLSGGCTLNLVKGNFLNDNDYTSNVFGNGIILWGGSNNTIVNNTMNGNEHHGILLYSSSKNNTVYNNTVNSNLQSGIYIWSGSDFNDISFNTAKDNRDHGIYVQWYSDNNTIEGNFISNNWDQGIYIHEYCTNNTVENNTAQNIGASDQNNGIMIYDECDFNIVRNNTLYNNAVYGIYLVNTCNNNTFANNTINFNSAGMYIAGCGNNTFIDNKIYNSTQGLCLTSNSNENLVIFNLIFNTSDAAIFFYNGANNNTFKDNIIRDNLNMGVGITPATNSNNTFYNNTFINNFIHAVDNGTYNQWDNGSIGNFWDNYTGVDLNEDGIGDSPYNITGTANSKDNYPIWDDGLGPIMINATASNNWTWAKSVYSILGSGSLIDPYILEDYVINASGYTFGIYIINSKGPYFIIRNCTVYESIDASVAGGIRLENCSFGQIYNNTVYDNGKSGIILTDSCQRINIYNNTVGDNNGYYGIHLIQSDDNLIYNNTGYDNGYHAIYLEASDYNSIFNNTAYSNDDNGIVINSFSKYNNVTYNYCTFNADDGIYLLGGSRYNNISNNWVYRNNQHGIYLENVNENNIFENIIYDNGNGIKLENSYQNSIYNNTIYDTGFNWQSSGIFLETNCHNNTIEINNIYDNTQYGVRLQDNCDDNIIYNNSIRNIFIVAQDFGVYIIINCDNNTIENNWIDSQNNEAIRITTNCHYTFIINNTLENTMKGIYFGDNDNCTIRNNTIRYTTTYGIQFYSTSEDNKIYNNTFINNTGTGMYLQHVTCIKNLIYFNYFFNNTLHAQDNGSLNAWDNGKVGNYWDNYTGEDTDDNNRGDTPYIISGSAGSQDNFPIYSLTWVPSSDSGTEPPSDPGKPPEEPPWLIILLILLIAASVCAVSYVLYRRKNTSQPIEKEIEPKDELLEEAPKSPVVKPKKKKESPIKDEPDAFEKKKIMKETAITESEMEIVPDQDFCVIHKGPIRGIIYSCPKCGVKYCMKCATTLKERKENCWSCEEKIDV